MILCEPGVTQPSCTSWSFAVKVWVLIAKLRTLVTRLTPIDVSVQNRRRVFERSGCSPFMSMVAVNWFTPFAGPALMSGRTPFGSISSTSHSVARAGGVVRDLRIAVTQIGSPASPAPRSESPAPAPAAPADRPSPAASPTRARYAAGRPRATRSSRRAGDAAQRRHRLVPPTVRLKLPLVQRRLAFGARHDARSPRLGAGLGRRRNRLEDADGGLGDGRTGAIQPVQEKTFGTRAAAPPGQPGRARSP